MFFGLHVTEVNVAVKIGRLVVFYCIEPHCGGVYWYQPEIPKAPRVRWFLKVRPSPDGIR